MLIQPHPLLKTRRYIKFGVNTEKQLEAASKHHPKMEKEHIRDNLHTTQVQEPPKAIDVYTHTTQLRQGVGTGARA